MTGRSQELSAAQRKILRAATKLANRTAREELLADSGEFSLVQRLAVTKGTSIAVLRGAWNPFKPDYRGTTGYEFKLQGADDKLVVAILKDMGLLKRMNEIATEAVAHAALNNKRDFTSSLLNDLFSEEPFYTAKTRQGIL